MRAWMTWFVAALVVVGIPWWTAPYNRFSFGHPLAMFGCLAYVSMAAWVAGGTPLGLRRGGLALGAAVPSAVLLRVIVDVTRASSSHNLWPFEVVFAAVFGFGVAFGAGLVGWGLGKILRSS
jgi:hypothetical protein